MAPINSGNAGHPGWPLSGCADAATLTALAEGRIAGRRRERLEAHLDGCGGCRGGLARIEAARSTFRAIAEWAPPQTPAGGTARLEATLRWTRKDASGPELAGAPSDELRERRRRGLDQGLRHRLRYVGWAAAAAAVAAATGGLLLLRHGRGPAGAAVAHPYYNSPAVVPDAPGIAPAPARAVPERHGAAITLLGGEVRLVGLDGSQAALETGRPLGEGDRVLTGEGARLAFQWGEGSGALLEGGSELLIGKLQVRSQELSLLRGRIAVRVGPHQPGESMRVRSPDHDITVHGTWFVVGAFARGTTVEVLEGVVEVASPVGDGASTRLSAPSRAVFHRGSGLAIEERALSGREAQAVRAGSEMGLLAWTDPGQLLDENGLLHVSSSPPADLVVDGVSFGLSPLSLRRPHGRHLVELSRAGFATVRRWVGVGDSPAALDEALAARLPQLASVPPSPEEVMAIASARRAHSSACYERVLKRDPSLAGTLTLQMNVGPAGQVLRTRVGDDTLHDPQVIGCLRHEVAGWLFPRTRNAIVSYTFVFRAR